MDLEIVMEPPLIKRIKTKDVKVGQRHVMPLNGSYWIYRIHTVTLDSEGDLLIRIGSPGDSCRAFASTEMVAIVDDVTTI